MLDLIARGVSLGLTASLLPGPLQAYIIQTALLLGWRRSLIVALSPLVTDVPIILIVLFFLSQFPPAFIRVVQVVGGVFLLYMAWGAWQDVRKGVRIGAGGGDAPTSRRGILSRAVLMNFLSPGPYLFWGTVNGPLLIQGLNQSPLHGAGFLVAFYGTFLGMLVALVLLTDRLRNLSDRANRLILIGIMLALGVIGVSLIAQGVRG